MIISSASRRMTVRHAAPFFLPAQGTATKAATIPVASHSSSENGIQLTQAESDAETNGYTVRAYHSPHAGKKRHISMKPARIASAVHLQYLGFMVFMPTNVRNVFQRRKHAHSFQVFHYL